MGRSQDRGRSQERGRSNDSWYQQGNTFKCYYCVHEGRIKRNSRKFLREQGQNSQQPKKEDGEALVNIGLELAVLSCEEETCLHTSSQDTE
ncbi:hypothetical protein U1Q18_049788 [Sarracenia purpurea var. burkii]